MKKTLIVGIDGAEYAHITSHIDPWKLTFFKRMKQKGCFGKLESVIPPCSCPSWACFGTGKNPGKIGAFSFLDKKPKSYDMQLNHSVLNELYCFWDILSDAGKKVILLNMPLYGKRHLINGDFVAGDFLERPVCYPPELANKLLLDKKPLYTFYAGKEKSNERLINDCFITLQNRLDVAQELIQKDWDLFMVVLQLDTLEHFSWNHQENIQKYLQIINEWLTKNTNDDMNVIIMGDHGHGEVNGIFVINNWLEQEGFLVFKKQQKKAGIISKERISSIINKLGLMKLAIKLTPRKILNKVPSDILSFTQMREIIDWEKTKAFACGDVSCGSVYINLKDREPNGSVTKKEYDSVVKDICKKLKKVKGMNGEELEFDIHLSKDIYTGKFADSAPDIVFFINGMKYGSKFVYRKDKNIFVPSERQGDHKRTSILLGLGPDVIQKEVKDARLLDLAPTMLKYFKLPIDKEMDGKVLGIFKK